MHSVLSVEDEKSGACAGRGSENTLFHAETIHNPGGLLDPVLLPPPPPPLSPETRGGGGGGLFRGAALGGTGGGGFRASTHLPWFGRGGGGWSGTSEQLGMRPRCNPTIRTAPNPNIG